ncbi:hypothetical protein JOB18_016108 [Solea senegalensis]|uniref:Secreted protein n=1 Tax=Solea senegalensis TaxID=28829 RepID=A0AAV6RSQ2_SOLSE|nr:hypothetical protein JOB18_016108 [Solea senegalensis]
MSRTSSNILNLLHLFFLHLRGGGGRERERETHFHADVQERKQHPAALACVRERKRRWILRRAKINC